MDTMSSNTLCEELHKCLEPFNLSLNKLQEISRRLDKDLTKGLDKDTHDTAPVKMLSTFIRATSNGTEKGDFLTLDLGGTNLRVHHVHVNEETKELEIKSQMPEEPVPEDIMKGTGERLFDYIADRLGDLLKTQNLKDQTLPLGFTFSFACKQIGIDKCFLIRWTKGFSCSGVEGKDVVQLLKDAMKKKGYEISSVAVVNDTVSTMLSCSYKDPNCQIGMIIGTGTNACYMEEMKNVKYLDDDKDKDGKMCINTEWGGFGDDGSLNDIQTEFDKKVDEESTNPGVHIFEKMISGMYLGKIAQLLLEMLTKEKLLFKGQTPESDLLQKLGKFDTKSMSEIEESLKNAEKILAGLDLTFKTVDVHVVRLVCETISTRSARLCAAAIAAIAERIRSNSKLDHLKITVAVDGTVYKKHPTFSKRFQETACLLAPKCDFTFLISDGGSVKGAAVAAALGNKNDK